MYGPPVSVPATVVNGLALHKQAQISELGRVRFAEDIWTITHVKSGGALLTLHSRKEARKAFIRCLRYRLPAGRPGGHGIALGDMTGCEITANALILNAALSPDPKPAPVVLVIAAKAAEWLACAK